MIRQLIVWGKFPDPVPSGYRWCKLQVGVPASYHIHQLRFSRKPQSKLWAVTEDWVKIHCTSLNTHTQWQSQSHPLLLKLGGCKHLVWSQKKKHSFIPCPPHGAAAGRFGPQIMTDALDGSDPSPSAGARETGSNIEKTDMCVHHCQSRYTARYLHDGKLCQFIEHL